MKPKIIVALASGAEVPPEFAALSTVAEPIIVRTPSEYANAREVADILLVWDLASTLVHECGVHGLAWIHTNSIGVNAVASAEVAESEILVTNTRGLFEAPMAEFVLAAILAHAKGHRRGDARQSEEVWENFPSRLVRGRTAVVVGAGGVGRAAARLLRAVGMQVSLLGRSAREDDEFGKVHGSQDLHALLGEADDVVLAAPLTDRTRHMLGAPELQAMKPSAHLVNVGRGALLDEAALLSALRSGVIAAASLDVVEREPLAAGHPFWSMHNVAVSAHRSANYDGWRADAVALFLQNLERWREGLPLENKVDIGEFVVAG